VEKIEKKAKKVLLKQKTEYNLTVKTTQIATGRDGLNSKTNKNQSRRELKRHSIKQIVFIFWRRKQKLYLQELFSRGVDL
jgi:hypothetical protein